MRLKPINRILASAGLGMAFAGCFGVGDDLSGCVRDANNVTLTFHCTDEAGKDIFQRKIGSVDAFIFDGGDLLVARGRFEAASDGGFRGWKLALPAGEYRVMCWGNAGINSRFSGITPGETTLDECRVEIDSAAATGDSVFYAPRKAHPAAAKTRAATDYSLVVPSEGPVAKEMYFGRAYRSLNVYVAGFSDGGLMPVIEAVNLWGAYDFLYNTLGGRFNFARSAQSVSVAGLQVGFAPFRHAFGEMADDMAVVIRKASDGSAVWTVNLKEFIEQNPGALKEDIDLLIEFSGVGVTVGVPGWLDRPITPGK